MLIRRLLHPYLRNELADAGADAGGGAPASSPDTSSTTSAPAGDSAPAGGGDSTPSGPSRSPDGRFAPDVGQTMYEAMFGKEGLAGAEEQSLEAAQPGQQPQAKQPQAEDKDEDLTRPLKGPVSPETQQRFQKLTSTLKQKDQDLVQARSQAQYHQQRADTFVSILQGAGVTQDDFVAYLDFKTALRTGNFEGAQAYLKKHLTDLSIASGRNLAGDDSPLAEFPDLAAAVANMQITEEHALELARGRRVEQSLKAQSTRRTQDNQARQNFEVAKRTAMQSVAKQVAEWKKADIDFAAKEPKIAAQMKRLRGTPPDQWLTRVQEFYELLNEGASMAGGGTPQGDIQRPLRGGAGPAAAARAPASMYEAMFGSPKPA